VPYIISDALHPVAIGIYGETILISRRVLRALGVCRTVVVGFSVSRRSSTDAICVYVAERTKAGVAAASVAVGDRGRVAAVRDFAKARDRRRWLWELLVAAPLRPPSLLSQARSGRSAAIALRKAGILCLDRHDDRGVLHARCSDANAFTVAGLTGQSEILGVVRR
jgi:hypothetical protein